jgi:hypothetical protein
MGRFIYNVNYSAKQRSKSVSPKGPTISVYRQRLNALIASSRDLQARVQRQLNRARARRRLAQLRWLCNLRRQSRHPSLIFSLYKPDYWPRPPRIP